MLSEISMKDVFNHYQVRQEAHKELKGYFDSQMINDYNQLAVGVSKPQGNYSASEHSLGPRILLNNSNNSIFQLAKNLNGLNDSHHIPKTIYDANLSHLRISVGSEMAMMLNPDKCWVGNIRTIYSHLLLKPGFNTELADEELKLYKEPDGIRPSSIEYQIWRDIYLSLESSLNEIALLGKKEAKKQNSRIGDLHFMWADAICSLLYGKHH